MGIYVAFFVVFCLGIWTLGKLTDKFQALIS